MTAEKDDNRDLFFPANESRRASNPGAEQWIGKKVEIHNHGFIYLVDCMGNDQSIEQAARVSYGEGTRKATETEGLIRRLMRDEHTSPFEMAELKFHVKMPIFVARQWIRHRTANVNEISGRYSVLKNEFYIPEVQDIAAQSKNNKQGRGDIFDKEDALDVQQRLETSFKSQAQLYEHLLNDNGEGNPQDENRGMLAREVARIPLPVSTYTEMYWKIDLHNLLHFLQLRMDPHAQKEIRDYANVMGQIVSDTFPITWKAFKDYRLDAMKLSGPEQSVLVDMLQKSGIIYDASQFAEIANSLGLVNKSEQRELREKFKKLGIVKE